MVVQQVATWKTSHSGRRWSGFRTGSASSHGAVIVIATLKIDRGNPVAASVGIARTHHVDAIPAGLSLDGSLIPVSVS